VLDEAGQHEALRTALDNSIREHSATAEMLVWLINERDGWRELITPELLTSILSTLERDEHRVAGRTTKLHRALVEDRELLGEMFANSDVAIARDAMRRLQLSPLLDELTKRSLLARIVKIFPELESMIAAAQPAEKIAPLIVSWSSLEKRKREFEELVKKKIPENTKEISIARSYGDLSENFEYKAAKQMQAVLIRRRTELEQMLHRARGTSFENPDTSRVSIGTVVTVRDVDSKKEETYTILGAWDGDPERHIVSYQTAIGQALLGHTLGEVVTLNDENGTGSAFEIVSIEPAEGDKAIAAAPEDQPEPVVAE
jgi:transcription elongation GreA/GreB family factor